MIKNSDLFYARLKTFQDGRARLTKTYEAAMGAIKPYKGSKGYNDKLKQLQDDFDEGLARLQADARHSVGVIADAMTAAIGQRPAQAPSEEQMRILSALKLKKRITPEESAQAAEALRDCPLAVSVLKEMAADVGIHGVRIEADDLSAEEALAYVDALRGGAEDFISSDVRPGVRRVRERRERLYGAAPEQDRHEREASQRPLFDSKLAAFNELARLRRLDAAGLERFCRAVDGGIPADPDAVPRPQGNPEAVRKKLNDFSTVNYGATIEEREAALNA